MKFNNSLDELGLNVFSAYVVFYLFTVYRFLCGLFCIQ